MLDTFMIQYVNFKYWGNTRVERERVLNDSTSRPFLGTLRDTPS